MRTILKGKRRGKKRNVKGHIRVLSRDEYTEMDISGRMEMIKMLIPLGLMAIEEELQREVALMARGKYERKETTSKVYRHGTNPGSVHLGGQKVPIRVPRLRNGDHDIRLESYTRFHEGTPIDEGLFRKVLYGISCRNYGAAAEAIPGTFGLTKSTVSKRFIEASQAKVQEIQERDLSALDVIAILLDGKSFAEDEMVTAIGITIGGEKVVLGFIQTDTENERVLKEFLKGILSRGLKIEKGTLVVVDGSKGIISSVKKVFGKRGFIQRCQWHKRENVVSYMSKSEQAGMRKRLQRAYERPTYEEAQSALMAIYDELEEQNQSAAASLLEGFEDTLTLHRLGVFPQIGRSLKTTNGIESIHAMIEQLCGKVDYWKTSKQKHRWLASALLDIEPRLRKVKNYKSLYHLRNAMMNELDLLSMNELENSKLAA